MELVIDANIMFSALITSAGKNCDLIFSEEISLFAPEFLRQECEKHTGEIVEKSGLSKEDFSLALSLISARIRFVPFDEFKTHIREAMNVCPDPNDVEYFAVALKLCCPLWSNDKSLAGQKKVRVLSTADLLRLLQ